MRETSVRQLFDPINYMPINYMMEETRRNSTTEPKILRQISRSCWIRRRVIFKSLVENDFFLENEMDFKRAFMFLDADRDGVISFNDLTDVVK